MRNEWNSEDNTYSLKKTFDQGEINTDATLSPTFNVFLSSALM